MPVGRGGGLGRQRRFAQYPPRTFATVPQGVLAELVARRVGRNGWAVMVALCRKLYDDGLLGRSSSAEVSALTGLTSYQVARGMTELRQKGLISPVIVKDSRGVRSIDRSGHGHVAQYCIAKDVWVSVQLQDDGQADSR